jgi:uncharacterized membrane protein YeaQ/YmgE (transglycosylase-associated protein family)
MAMTATLLSLISIFIGIIGSNLTGFILKKYSFGIIGNTIAGVFGSIFLIKSLGRFGFDPKSILQQGNVNLGLFALNIFMSFLGGAIAVILIYKLKHKLN